MLAHQELLEQESMVRQLPGGVAVAVPQELIAHGQQAGRLQSHHGHAARDEGQQRIERAARLRLGLVHQPGREERAAAAQRPLSRHRAQVHGVAGGFQHALRGTRIGRLHMVVEGVDKQQYLLAAGLHRWLGRLACARAAKERRLPLRQRAPRR